MERRDFLKSMMLMGGACIAMPTSVIGQAIRTNAAPTVGGQDRAMLFDIQRFGLHDGPGIRTVVFLKGCPLRCAWCFNPESFDRREQMMFLDEKCTKCGVCVDACVDDALRIENGVMKISYAQCSACGKCAEVCAQRAMKKVGYLSTIEQIVEIAKKDMNYYGSDGGVTLSGGEAMYQPEIAKQLLKALKQEGIHTCIETTGYADRQHYRDILPYTDIFLFDYKLTSEKDHLKWTRVSNKKILENLDFIAANGANIVLCCPVIPGVNDNDAHFEAIARLGQKYPNIRYAKIEPYVSYGVEKYAQLGRKAPLSLKSVDKAVGERWVERIKSFGYDKVKLG